MTRAELDPDLTPTTTPWEEYLAATRSLAAVRHDAAAAAATATHQASAARARLAQVRAELARQRAALAGAAARTGAAPPRLVPTPQEQAAGAAAVTGDPVAVPAALQFCQQLIRSTDVQLGAPPPPPGHRWWPPPRWLPVVVGPVAAAVLAGTVLFVLALLR